MAYTEKRVVAGSLITNSIATYYTVPASATAIIKEMTVCNTDASTPYTFSLYIVPSAGTYGDANVEFKSVTLQPLETRIFSRTCVMAASSTIQAIASTTSKIALSVSGVERT